ncbi:hypothetical protein [Paraclostridium bifermentans]|uniref:hypothetical protein n=1 Tax=Paraclostridium bifermentans TaxID=1490 RepID=UPI00242E1B2F|nr:hypothetical protein [Paraclostridium bifermentans]
MVNTGLAKVNENIDKVNSNIKENTSKIESESVITRNNMTDINEKQMKIVNIKSKDIINSMDTQLDELKNLVNLYEKNEELIEDNIEKLVVELNDNKDMLSQIIKYMKRAKSDIIESIEENIDSNKEVVGQYKEIQGSMMKELHILLDKNKHITELLMSNYKVLNALMEA